MRIAFSVVLSLLLATTCIRATELTAQITGTVRDPTGLAIPGAEVKATQTATGLVRNVNSGADGGYVLPNLPVGPYILEVKQETGKLSKVCLIGHQAPSR